MVKTDLPFYAAQRNIQDMFVCVEPADGKANSTFNLIYITTP